MNFLIALDGSDASDQALDYALKIAGRLDAELVAVHTVEPALFVTEGGDEFTGFGDAADRFVAEALDDAEATGARLLDEAAERAAEVGVEMRTELLYGTPLDVIPEFAAEAGVDGIFVGHRGLSRRHESMVGSVAKGLVERSSVPVTVVR